MTSPTTQGANYFLPPSPVQPMLLNIVSITNSNPMVVTVATPNYWIVGQLAYFTIPFIYGMQQLNTKTAQIIDVDPTNLIFTFALNSSNFDPCVIPDNPTFPVTMVSQGSRNTYNFNELPYRAINANIGN